MPKLIKNPKQIIKLCKTCNSTILCDLCIRFGKVEGEKWKRQQKYYMSE